MFTMFRLAIKKYQPGFAIALLIALLIFSTISGIFLYFVSFYGTYPVFGIPAQLLVATIVLPVLLIALIFHIAKKLDEHAWSNEREL